jgi:hypothetical protein
VFVAAAVVLIWVIGVPQPLDDAFITFIDHFGLVSPQVLQLGIEKSIERYQPDFYIGYPWSFAIGKFNRLPAFAERYELLARLPAEGTDTLLIYRRRAPYVSH